MNGDAEGPSTAAGDGENKPSPPKALVNPVAQCDQCYALIPTGSINLHDDWHYNLLNGVAYERHDHE